MSLAVHIFGILFLDVGYVNTSLALNSSLSVIFRNDLWALGCTLYQMLSGASPFKDASDWLIFQRIITRDLRFPEYFSDEASDLIDKLLVSNENVIGILLAMITTYTNTNTSSHAHKL